MPKTESLPKEYRERPKFVRVTISLPADLAAFVAEQAKRFPSVRGEGNASAYFRELSEAHRARFVGGMTRMKKASAA